MERQVMLIVQRGRQTLYSVETTTLLCTERIAGYDLATV